MANNNQKLTRNLTSEDLDKIRGDSMGGTFVMQIPSGLTNEQMEQLKLLVNEENKPGVLAGPGAGAMKLEDIRRSEIRWLDHKQYKWLYDVAWKIAKKANEKYRFDIKPIKEIAQLSIYDESVQGFYSWHTDATIYNTRRKISISIPISSPAEYVGGELQFMAAGIGGVGIPGSVLQPKGGAIVFPSYEMHRVTPVTKGRRYSLVIWISGPSWR